MVRSIDILTKYHKVKKINARKTNRDVLWYDHDWL